MKEKEIKVEVPEVDFSSIKDTNTKEKKREITVTAEEQDLIFKGIRPETMEYAVYKQVRKELQKAKKLYLGGQFKHISVNLNPQMYNVESKGTYIRTEPKRYETLNRLWQRKGQNDSKQALVQ